MSYMIVYSVNVCLLRMQNKIPCVQALMKHAAYTYALKVL